MARPRKHDRPKIIKAVCVAISGGQLVNDACKAEGITAGQLREWVAVDAKYSALYARAREEQAHAIADEAIALADAAVPGKFGDVDKVRLQVDARKWLASKIAPRLYGEKLEVAGDPERPLVTQVWQFGAKTVTF